MREREAADRLLGKENRLEVSDRLAATTEKLRRPFLDLMARIGALQPDPISWWSTRLSWRIWTASDLFLLICHLAIARDLIRESREQGFPLRIVANDPWLRLQLLEDHSGADASPLSLPLLELSLGAVGLLRRIGWLLKTVRHAAAQRLLWPGGGWPGPGRPAVGICSYPLRSSLGTSDGWEDHHLPGLDRLLQESGYQVVRFTPPDCAGFERELARRSSYFRPLILFATPSGIWRSFTARWRPRWPGDLSVRGIPIRRLLDREAWLERSRASLCGFRLFYETADRLLSSGSWRWVVTSYENQPWEKMLALAARRHGVRVAGIQTALLSRDYLPYRLGRGEAERMPLPDVLCASGPYAQEVLAQEDDPPRRIRLCGAIRYRQLPQRVRGPAEISPPSLHKILVALPIHPPVREDLLAALRAAFPDGGAAHGLSFQIRPHPLSPLDPSRLQWPARLLPSTFHDIEKALSSSGLILFAGSTVGFEAMARHRAVLRYRPALSLDVDSDVYGEGVPSCSERDLRDSLLRLVREGPGPRWEERCRAEVLKLFAPFDPSVLIETLMVK